MSGKEFGFPTVGTIISFFLKSVGIQVKGSINKSIQRFNNMKKIDELINKLNDMCIDYEIFLIYGLPKQTFDSFRETINWCINREVKKIKAFPLLLLRGTELYENSKEYGFTCSFDESIMVNVSNSFSNKDWIRMKKLADSLSNKILNNKLRIII